jgi:sporulation protein YlmC with PRC-barrel domain
MIRELVGKQVVCENLNVGTVTEIIFDLDNWKITHLEVELTRAATELCLGFRKGGVRNRLSVSAIGKVGKTIELKVKKGQLKYIYLKPIKTTT